LAILALVLTALGGAVTSYGYTVLDWGCLSPAEIERPLTTSEVMKAFNAAGFDLQPTKVPVGLRAGARVYRHETEDASIFVVIYRRGRTSTHQSQPVFKSLAGSSQGVPYGIQFLNIDIGLTEAHLAKSVNRVVEDLNRSPGPGDRCYTN
jgi:hypothetical protein